MDSPLTQPARGNHNVGLGTPKRGVSVIQAANRLRNASGTPNRHPSNLGPATQVGPAGAPVVAPALVIESQRFEEWMKIATDNVSPNRAERHAAPVGTQAERLTGRPGWRVGSPKKLMVGFRLSLLTENHVDQHVEPGPD